MGEDFIFTSFSGHRPAQRERARTGLIGPMQGTIPFPPRNRALFIYLQRHFK